MPGLDFDWNEGDFPREGSSKQPESRQAVAAPESASGPPSASDKGVLTASNLALLVLGVLVGMVLGVLVLIVQGQRNARADLEPFVALQYQALAENDLELLESLIDPQDEVWREMLASVFPVSTQLFDLATPPRVKRVDIDDAYAEVEIEYDYQGHPYRRSDAMIRVDGQWRMMRAQPSDWGDLKTVESTHTILHFYPVDAYLSEHLPFIDETVVFYCLRYGITGPCRLDLTIASSPDLQPFVPGSGLLDPPNITDLRVIGQGSTGIIMLNGTQQIRRNPAFQDNLLGVIRAAEHINQIHAASSLSPEQEEISQQRLTGEVMPLDMLSPQLVGLDGVNPHPLWMLSLTEAIGDSVLRRALGALTGEEKTIYTLWALARSDVALTAEVLSGNGLTAIDDMPDAMLPVEIGAAYTRGDTSQRHQLIDLGHFLYEGYGEAEILEMLRSLDPFPTTDSTLPGLGTDMNSLLEEWERWQSEN